MPKHLPQSMCWIETTLPITCSSSHVKSDEPNNTPTVSKASVAQTKNSCSDNGSQKDNALSTITFRESKAMIGATDSEKGQDVEVIGPRLADEPAMQYLLTVSLALICSGPLLLLFAKVSGCWNSYVDNYYCQQCHSKRFGRDIG